MRKILVQDAIGEVLCHDMTAILADGFKGVKFKRGHVITKEDIPELLDIGKTRVFVWEPEKDEVHEDDAGLAVTEAICGGNISFSGASEGKFQINSEIDGLFCLNAEALRAINSVPDFTVASRPGYTAVSKGEKLAGARIVPLVTKRENVDLAVKQALESAPVMCVKPYLIKKVGAIITGSEIYNGRIQDQFEPILHRKVERYGAVLECVTICDDDLEMIINCINSYIEDGIELILLTGGMSVDPDDLTPSAIRESGARVVTQGVPMQPGNMLTIAYLKGAVLVGVPGASMHFQITSFDVFLPRIMAGIIVEKKDITGLGAGGFCMSCGKCSYPMCFFGYSVNP